MCTLAFYKHEIVEHEFLDFELTVVQAEIDFHLSSIDG